MSYIICVAWFTVRGICLPRYIFNGDSHIVPTTRCSRSEKGRGRVGDSAGGGGRGGELSLRVSCQHNIRLSRFQRRIATVFRPARLFIYLSDIAYLFIYLFGRLFITLNCNTFPRRKVPFWKSVCRKAKLKFVGKGSERASEAALLVNSQPVWCISFWNNNNKLRVLGWVPVCIVNISLALTHI